MSEEHLDSVKLELEEKEREKSDLGELKIRDFLWVKKRVELENQKNLQYVIQTSLKMSR